jgi:hypothetical protein
MVRILRVLNWIVLGIEIVICTGCLKSVIVFGHGLGDLYYYVLVFLATITHLSCTIAIRKANHPVIILMPLLIFSTTTTLICLKATVWRGPEYSWKNGRLFHK